MTAKELLRELEQQEALIHTKKERVATLKAMAASTQGSAPTGMPRNPGAPTSKMADMICRAVDLEAEILEDEYRLLEKRLVLLDKIGALTDPDHQSVLIKRYFERLSWEDIAKNMHFTTRWIYKLHGLALTELDRQLTEKTY